ncbi:sensor histidine kinase [uncultured Parabacteroides sp.]|jgi:signal transduction histidine kinase|uniref:sensor histidine kinase n=1 Tax=uncultured Parabacteroides sp. TaxID=512312 RepID=UPI0025E23D0D|nr:HAMP domain-containing sensor histidine kinase [uncultured Parabacteroides sp.]
MKTRLRFKIIAALICLSLAGLLISQGYWLKGLYVSSKKSTWDNIEEAMRMADYMELFLRLDSLSKNNFHGQINPQFNFSQDTEKRKDSLSPDSMTISSSSSTIQYMEAAQTLNEYLQMIGTLERDVQILMHQKIDTLLPANYAQFNTLLKNGLQERGITVPYRLQVIRQGVKDSVLYTYTDASGKGESWKSAVRFTHAIEPEQYYYDLELQSPDRVVFRQMAGILISSLLLFMIILVAFVYLLYTILRQKTIEELKTDFTNNMTHELKTPISVAYAANDVLLNYSNTTNEKQKKYLNIVREQLNHLSGLVEQILTLSVENRSTFRLRPETIQVAELLTPLIEQFKLKTDKPIDITTEIPEDMTVTADRTHLYNMLSNLIGNAVKYSGEKACRITLKGTVSPKETTLSVTDEGIGISEANQKRVFDKFYRVPSGNLHDVKGFGLGLYYVSDMMSKHNGTVTVKSQPGKGSTFTLHFKN